MPMKSADRSRCGNPDCAREKPVKSGGEVQAGNPRCACGAPMKKKSPAFSYLEFLRVDEPLVPRGSSPGA